MPRYTLNVDGVKRTVEAAPDEPLLYPLTGALGLKGPRFGCGLAQCGTCTVLVDGVAVRSCVTPTSAMAGKHIRTLDGLPKNGKPHPVQAAFIEEQAAQCGYCSNGWVMHTVALLEKNQKPSEAEIHDAFANVQCRCGTHIAIMRAVKTAAAAMSGAPRGPDPATHTTITHIGVVQAEAGQAGGAQAGAAQAEVAQAGAGQANAVQANAAQAGAAQAGAAQANAAQANAAQANAAQPWSANADRA